jgi:phage-related protein
MRRWRDYQTGTGRRPVKQFIEKLGDDDVAAIMDAMREVKVKGLASARHLDGDIYEVRADGDRAIYRVLFAPQGRRNQVLLALEALKKKTQKTPPQTVKLAKQRLRDWESRGRQ